MTVLKNVILLLVVMTSLVGCSNSDDTRAASTEDDYAAYPEFGEDSAHRVAAEPPAVLPVVNRERYHTIEIKQMKFFPAVLTLQKGDTVVWVNNGITAHDVTQQPSATWTSSSIPVGKSWSMVATESADYYCSIHVVMTGKLVVK